MQTIKEHIVFKILTLFLVATLLVPTIIKVTHIFTHKHHKNDICKGEKRSHLHEISIDCEFYKFKINSHFYKNNTLVDFIVYPLYYKINALTYNFLNNHQQLSFLLRGPPLLV